MINLTLSNSSGDSIPRDLEMLQSLQEMLVKISHIEVSIFANDRVLQKFCSTGRKNEDTATLESVDIL